MPLHLQGMSQQALLEIFIDWYDYVIQFPDDPQGHENLREIRARIDIRTSTGMEPTTGEGI